MSNADKANSFLEDLGIDDELMQEIQDANAEPSEPETQYIVYFKGDKPDTVWEYFHKPEDGKIFDINGDETGEYKPYGRIYGYWDEDPEKGEARHFVENKSNNLKLMDWDTFMSNVVPNKDCTKVFDSEADFLLELI